MTTCVVLAVIAFGCSGVQTGTQVSEASVPSARVPLRRALTTEPGGLRVLWNGPVRGLDFDRRGYIAGDRSQFGALWLEVGAPRRQPAVDFAEYVVFAIVGEGAQCPWEVLAVDLEPDDVLRVRTDGNWSCTDVAVRRALVLAVPRRLLGASVTLIEHGAFTFDVPQPGEASAPQDSPPSAPAQQEAPQGESVAVPERGRLSLRTLSNGMQVWVVHHRDGSLNVLAATLATKDWPRSELAPFLWQVITYSQDEGRFIGGYDARGQSVHGWAPIQAFTWTRLDEGHIALGGTVATRSVPIQARDAAPMLEGPSRAYTDLPLQSWASVKDGHVARLDVDLVVRDQGAAQLCHAPDSSASLESFTACPTGSPLVLGSSNGKPPHMLAHVLYGPLVVQRRRQAASVIVTTPPEMRSLTTSRRRPRPQVGHPAAR